MNNTPQPGPRRTPSPRPRGNRTKSGTPKRAVSTEFSTFYESLGKGKTGGGGGEAEAKGGSGTGAGSSGGSKASTSSFNNSKSDVALDDVDQKVMVAYDQSMLVLQKKMEEEGEVRG